jgi:ParB/RepB/Spo0J family partition protein
MSRSRPSSSIALDTLLEDERDSTPAHIADAAEKSFDGIPGGKLIPLDRIDTWERQPRKSFDEAGIAELAASIADSGVLEPLVVRRHAAQPGRYVVIAGHRRLLAARRVHGSEDATERSKVEALPCVIREATDAIAFADALVENLVRKDLTRREMMDAVKTLKDEYRWSVSEIARRTGRNQHDLSVLVRIAADADLSQLVADDIISPTALGKLVEEKHKTVRGGIIADIRAGLIKTVGDVDEAVKAAHAALDASTRPTLASDITSPTAPRTSPDDGTHEPMGASDITSRAGMPGALPAAPERPMEAHLRHNAPVPQAENAPARTVPVHAHERRVSSASAPIDAARFERTLADALPAIRSCLPLDAADQAKWRAFVAEVFALIDATEE